jgi:ABC-2 type transport system permease protein
LSFPIRILGWLLPCAVAAFLPLTAGIDAMRQVLFPRTASQGLMPVWVEMLLLTILSITFVTLARYWLAYLERRARLQGRLTVRLQ